MYDEMPSFRHEMLDTSVFKREEKLAILYTALCNGMFYFDSYGIETKIVDPQKYRAIDTDIREDRMIKYIADGGVIEILDGDETVGNLSMATLEANFDKVSKGTIFDFLQEGDDADTADTFLQVIAFGEVVYG
jgi:hypothetical protein